MKIEIWLCGGQLHKGNSELWMNRNCSQCYAWTIEVSLPKIPFSECTSSVNYVPSKSKVLFEHDSGCINVSKIEPEIT